MNEDNTTEAQGTEIMLPTPDEPKTKSGREIMALKAGAALEPVIPSTLEDAFRFAQMVCAAGLAPKSYEDGGKPSPQKVVIGILTGLELGVAPMQALSGIAIINNRPSIWGDLAVALCQSKGVLKSFESNYTGTKGEDDYTCHVVIWRKGQDSPYTGEFSVDDAKRAKLWMNTSKDPWVKYPYRMLFNRARAFALRDGFADCLAGLAIAEEAQDLPPPPTPIDTTAILSDDVPQIEHTPTPETPAPAQSPQEAHVR